MKDEAGKILIIAVLFAASLFVCYRVFRSSSNEIRAAQTEIITSQRDNEEIASTARRVEARIDTAQDRINTVTNRVASSVARVDAIERVVSSSTSFIDQAESTIDDCLSIIEEIEAERNPK